MELYFLNADFSYASAPIDDYLSLTWRDRYSEAGDFSLALSPELAGEAMRAAYVMNSERGIMEITGVTYSAVGQRQLTVTGTGLLGILNRRIMTVEGTRYDTVGNIVRARVGNETQNARAFMLPLAYDVSGASDAVYAALTRGANLYDWIVTLLQRTDYGAEITLDRTDNQLLLRVFKGLDRTAGQTTNSAAIFSQSFENIRELEIRKSVLDYKNVCHAYTGSGWYTRNRQGTDERRETYIMVGSDAAEDVILSECDDVLAGTTKVDSVSGTADQGDLVYKRDYNVGDICTFSDQITGISGDARISEVTTIYENGATRVIPAFGNQTLNLREFIKRNGGGTRVVYQTAPESAQSEE